MFMRFVQLTINPDTAAAFERFYEHRVSAALLAVDGCMFARLIKGTDSSTEFISFTLWASAEHAIEYESSGQYASLIAENEPFEMESTEWKIQLSADNTLEYKPVREEPTVKAMPVVAGTAESDVLSKIGDHTYLRILNAKVLPESFDLLSDLYDEEIVPKLLSVPGCQAAYLIGLKDDSEILSITIWDSEECARNYEDSGVYAELLDKTGPYLSSLYQWKMTLDPSKRDRTHLSDDISVHGYRVVSGESLKES